MTEMPLLDELTVYAFFCALEEMPHALPKEVQTKLNCLHLPQDTHQLDELAESCSELDERYQKVRETWQTADAQRTKGPLSNPNYSKEYQTKENENISKLTQSNSESKPANPIEAANQIGQATDSVEAAKALGWRRYCQC